MWFENEWKGNESASGDGTFFAEEGQDEGSERGPVEENFAVLPPFEPEEHCEEYKEKHELLGERGIPDDCFVVTFIQAPKQGGGNREMEAEALPAAKRCNQADVAEVKQETLDVENRLAETKNRICDGGEPDGGGTAAVKSVGGELGQLGERPVVASEPDLEVGVGDGRQQ